MLLALTATVALAATRYGTTGDDLMYGTNGNDYINFKDGKRDRVWCGPGRDSFTTDSVDVVSDCGVPAI